VDNRAGDFLNSPALLPLSDPYLPVSEDTARAEGNR
jgi:hypothetical protein